MIVSALIHSKLELSRALSCSEATVHKWCRKPNFPGGVAGPWDVATVAAWMQQRSQETQEDGADQSPMRRLNDGNKALKLREEVRRLKIKNDQLEKLLCERLSVTRQVSELVLMVKTRLESIPDEMEMGFPSETRHQNKLDFAERIRNVLKQMSQWRLET